MEDPVSRPISPPIKYTWEGLTFIFVKIVGHPDHLLVWTTVVDIGGTYLTLDQVRLVINERKVPLWTSQAQALGIGSADI